MVSYKHETIKYIRAVFECYYYHLFDTSLRRSVCPSVRPTPYCSQYNSLCKKWIQRNVHPGETTMENLSPPFFVCFENTVKFVHKNVYVRYKLCPSCFFFIFQTDRVLGLSTCHGAPQILGQKTRELQVQTIQLFHSWQCKYKYTTTRQGYH